MCDLEQHAKDQLQLRMQGMTLDEGMTLDDAAPRYAVH